MRKRYYSRNRRTRYRKSYYSNRSRIPYVGHGTLFPEKMMIKSPQYYTERFTGTFLDQDDGTSLYFGELFGAIRLNSWYNPLGYTTPPYDQLPPWYAQLAAFYGKYLVKYVTIAVTVSNGSADNFCVSSFPWKASDGAFSTKEWSTYLLRPWSKKRVMKGTGGGDAGILKFWHGMNPRVLQPLEIPNNLYADINADPGNLVYYSMYGQNMGGNSSYAVNIMMQMTQTVLLARTNQIPESNP